MEETYWSNDPLAHAAPAPAYAAAYLEGLNPDQREAVEATEGPVLVLAGAGTGKTRVLTTRLTHLLAQRRALPGQILTVTFTNKAAREMRDRVAALTGLATEGWWLGTFHAMAARILRRHAELVGLRPNFTILDTDDQERLLKQLIQAADIDGKRWPARMLLWAIERWKDRGLTPGQLKPEDTGDLAGGRMLALYGAYQERLRALNACDFGDLLLHNLTLFGRRESDGDAVRYPVLEEYHRRFRYLLVDEYQDTNVAQYLWLRALAQASRNLCCVGDEDQSIYGWRGAEIGNILRFESDFPGARVIRLEQNYRSTSHILGAASGLIANNRSRLGKTLYTRAEHGEPVVVRTLWDGEDEARWVGAEVEALQTARMRLDGIAVLVRAGFQMREFEDRLLTLGVPYRVVGGPRFYERLEIRDALAYLRVIAQPDDDLAFERIVNTPKRGLGPVALQALHLAARGARLPLSEAALRLAETDELKPKARAALRALMQDLERWRAMAGRLPHPELAQIVLDESGYTAMWQADRSPDAPGRLENLQELISAMREFENLHGFLEHVSLVAGATDTADGRDKVTLMTLHAAKGLEFEYVFLPGWEEGIFPNQRALEETGIAGLEEERRLAYVGLTRARQRAFVSHAASRLMRGQWQTCIPSRFVEELPEAHMERLAEPGLGPEARQPRWPSAFDAARPGGASARAARLLDGVAYTVAERPRPAVAFVPDDRVFHQKFGYGTVTAVDQDKLTIRFDHAGEKRVMDSFVVSADQAG